MSNLETRLNELSGLLEGVLPFERYRLSRKLRSMRRDWHRGRLRPRQLETFAASVQASLERRAARQDKLPRPVYDPSLPIYAHRQVIAEAIRDFPVVIVCGETGSGKSTQLPQICLELRRGVEGLIGHTQPRRIAAQSIAARLAAELGVRLGDEVGYKIRFTDRTHPATYIKLMTDGILLAETQGDRRLRRYDTIIIDEAHERSLNVDYLLGYLRRLLPKRPDLRVIVTSATLDASRFSQFFSTARGPAPIIEVAGRTFPVEVRYRPLVATEEEPEPDLARGVVRAVEELRESGPGDMLVFLPTEREIRETAKALRGWAASHAVSGLEILPLYARLSTAEQQRIFQPSPQRRIVLATNIAESSLTVPGIRYVIDSGTARISRYSPKAKVQRLPIEAVSRASADQRMGRCGRVGPGICIRLYSEDDYLARDAYTTPEIRRTNLASVILQTKILELGSIEEFPFLDPPRPDAMREGYRTLMELGALTESRELTPLGRQIGQFPVDPRIARIILAAIDEGCLAEALIIGAALEIQDPRERPADKREAADQAHQAFAHERSDFCAFLKMWDFYHQLREHLSRQQLKKACAQNFLSLNRLREWAETYRQLRQLVESLGYRVGPRSDDEERLHRALLTGLLSGIAYRREAFEYTGAGGNRFFLWPGSSVFSKRPKWIVAAEIVETSKRYGRCVAEIRAEWIEPLAAHLIKKRHVAPFWSRRRGAALVHEKVSLFGLPIVTDRVVPLAPIDPEGARRMFIQKALVEGDSTANFRFLRHNRLMLRRLMDTAARHRQGSWLIAESAQFEFYHQRLPPDIYDLHSLRRWLPAAERADPDVLRMRCEDFLPEGEPPVDHATYPDTFPIESLPLPLEYRYAPGEPNDGITVVVPVDMAAQLPSEPFEWLVPGRLVDKITALIRNLPKPIRRCLVPAPDTARQIAGEMTFGEGPFLKTLARMLQRRTGMDVPLDMLRVDALPPYLRICFRVVDASGKTLAMGRDLDTLVRNISGIPAASEPSRWHREGIREWDFGELPKEIDVRYGAVTLRRFPTLVDNGDKVTLTTCDTLAEAEEQLRRGLRRLFVLAEQAELRAQIAWLPGMDELRLRAAPVAARDDLERQIADLLAERAFLSHDTLPRTSEQFHAAREAGQQRIGLAVQEVTGLLHAIFEAYHAARLALERDTSPLWKYATEDLRTQLARLAPPGFLSETPWPWLQHFPRYFQGMVYRLERIRSGGLDRDRRAQQVLQPLLEQWQALADEHRELSLHDEALAHYRWMLEEFRISLFAQPLGTSLPVSEKRLAKQWALVRRPGAVPAPDVPP